jgi:hypothetical protein
MWSLLLVTLPTRPSAVRVRTWRALKSLGCASLRDGAYLLPREHEDAFEPLANDVREHGGTAMVLRPAARDDAQKRELVALFDRSDEYRQWRATADALQSEFDALGEAEARRRLRALAQALQDVQRIDYYAGAAGEQAAAALAALREALDARYSRGEPRARTDHGIALLDARNFRGKRWATRARPWVDRLACAWLIGRFIDPQARFLWLQDVKDLPRGAIGYDFDGARFTHVGPRVTFEVMATSFGLDGDPRLQRIGALVHYLDVGGIPVPEAVGLEAVLAGLRELHPDDDRLAAAAAAVFDAVLVARPGGARP